MLRVQTQTTLFGSIMTVWDLILVPQRPLHSEQRDLYVIFSRNENMSRIILIRVLCTYVVHYLNLEPVEISSTSLTWFICETASSLKWFICETVFFEGVVYPDVVRRIHPLFLCVCVFCWIPGVLFFFSRDY